MDPWICVRDFLNYLDQVNSFELKVRFRSEQVMFCENDLNNETFILKSVWLLSFKLKAGFFLSQLEPARDASQEIRNHVS